MKKLLALVALSLLTQAARAGVEVVYGKDNRLDVYKTTDSLHKKLSQSTAAMISVGRFSKAGEGKYDLYGVNTLERAFNVCSSEAFSSQPAAATCSGFLISPDTIVTAGHCYRARSTPEEACKNYAWIFGFEMNSEKADPSKGITLSNIYLCKEVLFSELNPTHDYAIIKLDRKVVGRSPLKFRASGKVSDSTSLVVIGHPTGIPTKISAGGKITRNLLPTTFSTNLDTFHGNSGSAVFDAKTGLVEGILIQGKNDYLPSKKDDPKSCLIVNTCDDNAENCAAGVDPGAVQWGEVVFRITTISDKLTKLVQPTP